MSKMYLKHSMLMTLVVVLLGACSSEAPKGTNGVTYRSAVQYNEYIVERQARLMKNIIQFFELAQSLPDSAQKLLDGYVSETGIMVAELKGMPAYKGDSAFRDASINTFRFYHKLFDKEYRDILHLRSEQDGLSTDIDERIGVIVNNIEVEEKEYDDRFQEAQKTFARKNKVKLVENEMQKKIEEKTDTGQ